MGCVTETMKWILNTFNVLLGIGGFAILVITTINLQIPIPSIVYYMYAIGGIALISSIIGCCGICQENVCLTTLYAVFIGITFVLQICTMLFVDDTASAKFGSEVAVNFLWINEKGGIPVMDPFQTMYRCCGKNSAKDYNELQRDPPQSCYDNLNNLYPKGCIEVLTELKEAETDIISPVFIGTMLILVIYFVVRFRNKQRHDN